MRIAFVGKGGSGKTTAAAAFSRHLAAQGCRVVAVDADINQYLGAALAYDGRRRPRWAPSSAGSRSTCGAPTPASPAPTR